MPPDRRTNVAPPVLTPTVPLPAHAPLTALDRHIARPALASIDARHCPATAGAPPPPLSRGPATPDAQRRHDRTLRGLRSNTSLRRLDHVAGRDVAICSQEPPNIPHRLAQPLRCSPPARSAHACRHARRTRCPGATATFARVEQQLARTPRSPDAHSAAGSAPRRTSSPPATAHPILPRLQPPQQEQSRRSLDTAPASLPHTPAARSAPPSLPPGWA